MSNTHAALLDALREAEDYLRNCANAPQMADKCRAAISQAEAAQPGKPWGRVVESGGTLICASSSQHGSLPLPVGALVYATHEPPESERVAHLIARVKEGMRRAVASAEWSRDNAPEGASKEWLEGFVSGAGCLSLNVQANMFYDAPKLSS